jgi:hypothetical protein
LAHKTNLLFMQEQNNFDVFGAKYHADMMTERMKSNGSVVVIGSPNTPHILYLHNINIEVLISLSLEFL